MYREVFRSGPYIHLFSLILTEDDECKCCDDSLEMVYLLLFLGVCQASVIVPLMAGCQLSIPKGWCAVCEPVMSHY